jgi:transcriptional regulator NrdR family protein
MNAVARIAKAVTEGVEFDDDHVTESLAKALAERVLEDVDLDDAVKDGIDRAIDAWDDDEWELVINAVAERVEQELAARATDIALAELQCMTRQAREGATAEQR